MIADRFLGGGRRRCEGRAADARAESDPESDGSSTRLAQPGSPQTMNVEKNVGNDFLATALFKSSNIHEHSENSTITTANRYENYEVPSKLIENKSKKDEGEKNRKIFKSRGTSSVFSSRGLAQLFHTGMVLHCRISIADGQLVSHRKARTFDKTNR